MLLAGLVLVWTNVRRELKLSRLKSDFVANVSHELKTPLALIRLFAETLELGRVPTEEKKQQYHRIINKESRRLTQLINNILDFSRIEAGRKEYRLVRGGRRRGRARRGRRLPLPDRAAGLRPRPRRRRGPAGDGDRPRGALPGAHQPAQQRDQVQPGAEDASRSRCGREGDRVLVSVRRPRASASRRRSRRGSSRSSTGSRAASCTPRRAAGSASPWCSTSWRPTGARSSSTSAPGEGSTFTLSLPVRRARPRRASRRPARRGTMGHRESLEQP